MWNYIWLSPQRSFPMRDNYSKRQYIPYPCGTVFFHSPQRIFQYEIYFQPKINSIPLWNSIWLPPRRVLNRRSIQFLNKFHIPVQLYFTLSQAELSIRDTYSLKYIPYPSGTVFYTPPAKFSIRDNYSIKYIPYPCGTVFYTPPPEFSTRDNFSLKNIPYPCGTASHTLPVEFSKEIIQSKIHPISLWNCILHSPCRVFKRDNFQSKIHSLSLWNCILQFPQWSFFNKR